jgi:hypothetical protein
MTWFTRVRMLPVPVLPLRMLRIPPITMHTFRIFLRNSLPSILIKTIVPARPARRVKTWRIMKRLKNGWTSLNPRSIMRIVQSRWFIHPPVRPSDMIATPQMGIVDEPIARVAVRPDVLLFIPLLERTPTHVNGITNCLRLEPHVRVDRTLSHSQVGM